MLVGVVPLAAAQQRARGGPAHVGVVLDGPSPFTDSLFAQFRREIIAFFGATPPVEFPDGALLRGDWTAAGIGTALDRLFADPGVDIVLALGPIGSNELARRRTLPKPALAALVIDAELQDLPVSAGTSGVRNLNYVNVAYSASRTLRLFHEIVPFHKLAVLIHPGLAAAAPRLIERAAGQAAALNVTLQLIPVTTSAADALRALPADADAAYLTPLEQLPAAGVDSVISGLTARRLPTFSYTGRTEVERGVLASYAPRDDLARRARRIAGNLQRILNGENAGTLPVDVASIAQLTLNMATARAIGFSPSWTTLTEAELINLEPPGAGPSWTLSGAVQEAVRANLDLLASDRSVASGRQSVRVARSGLLPQIQLSGTGTMVREETAAASMGQQAEQQGQASLSLSQAVVDEQAWARSAIAGHQQAGREASRRRTELDIALDGATAFLEVLKARARARVERENLRVTRSNLEVAQLRERTGAASRADVYRWESELASSRRSVIAADVRVQVAALELNRVINRPLEEPFQLADATLADPALLISEPRLFDYFGNPESFRLFRDFMVQEGRAASPELRGMEASIAAQRRSLAAAGRSFWLPVVSVSGGLSDVWHRGGAGAEPPSIGGVTLARGPDLSWTLRLQASLPLFTGFARSATRAQADIDLHRLTLERDAVVLAVDQRIRASLQVAGASWASIEQARVAAEAAGRNLELVTDAYTRGVLSITALLDAQRAALTAEQAAATAVYDFLGDLMRAERATGQFTVFRSAEERRAFLQRLDDFYRAAGAAPRRQ
jgi:outer membrane protein TolC/ABC-type uncharacterized transport system substrate-binding protein